MKIIDDEGNEHIVSGEAQARRIIRAAFPAFYGPRQNFNYGPHQGKHVAKTKGGRWQYKYVDHGKTHLGPTRTTEDEALEDYRRIVAGEDLAPKVARTFSAEIRANMSAARKARYEADRSASPDGRVHLPPPTCGGCGEVGHKKSACPKDGWTKKVYVRKKFSKGHCCAFCNKSGHKAPTCPKRKEALIARSRHVAA